MQWKLSHFQAEDPEFLKSYPDPLLLIPTKKKGPHLRSRKNPYLGEKTLWKWWQCLQRLLKKSAKIKLSTQPKQLRRSQLRKSCQPKWGSSRKKGERKSRMTTYPSLHQASLLQKSHPSESSLDLGKRLNLERLRLPHKRAISSSRWRS